MKTCRQLASEWNCSQRKINQLCQKGKIKGAVKIGGMWHIPDDISGFKDSAKYPYAKEEISEGYKRPLPVGISDYIRAQQEYYYVDKTTLIKDFLDRKPSVTLFTRPRRFGKTLNMDMLRVFFEKSETDTSVYFQDKAIWSYGEYYRKQQGRYPVIFLTFKDVKYDTWEDTFDKLKMIVQEEYSRHTEVLKNDQLSAFDKEYFNRVLNCDVNEVELSMALEKLSKLLTVHEGVAPIIIIDEYDTPIQEGYDRNYYDQIIGFMRNFFSGAFKDNRSLSFGFLTGIFRIAHESIFSGLNNLSVNTVMDHEYDSYFGFTDQEVTDMLNYYGMSDKKAELQEWYNGYIFGNQQIYNPWSVISYVSKGGIPQPYWVNTGKNEILKTIIQDLSDSTMGKLNQLLKGESVVASINQNVVYRTLKDDPENIFSVLVVAGYLKIKNRSLMMDGTYMCEVAVPDLEIMSVFRNEILAYMIQTGSIRRSIADEIVESLYGNDAVALQFAIGEYLNQTVSFYHGGAESFYHGLMAGFLALMSDQYQILSDRESGEGRYDICLFPKDHKMPGILLELKWGRNLDEDALEAYARKAMIQIETKKYDLQLKNSGITDILKFGVAFSGKKVKVMSSSE